MQWLITNRYYRANHVQINQCALSQLPEDGNLSSVVSVAADIPTSEHQDPAQEDDPYNAHLARSFVPVAGCSLTEQETIRQSVNQCQSGCATSTPSILMWPTVGGTPINEFTTEGYFSCAFPALFPTGAADFLGQRQNKVTILNIL